MVAFSKFFNAIHRLPTLKSCAFLFIIPSFSIHRVRYTNNNESENSYDVDVGNTKLMRKCYVEAK